MDQTWPGAVVQPGTPDVSPGWRIVSFIGLGLLMLAVAVGYAKTSGKRPSTLTAEGVDGQSSR